MNNVELKYRDNDYFNNKDYFLFKNIFGVYFTCKLIKEGSHYYTNTPLSIRCSSIISINCKEIIENYKY